MLIPTLAAGVSYAQGRDDCRSAQPPSIGVVVGRSSPYFDLAREVVEDLRPGTILVRGGYAIGARGDLSIAGPLRLRVEGSAARWDVERSRYDPAQNFQLIESTSVGHVAARQIGAALGLRGGRSPVCGYVLVGGGLYSVAFRDVTLRRPGVAITAGIEIPTGEHGKVQVDVQVHIIDTKSRPPVSGSAALAAALVAGWAYRF
jgi:hypothetical protein